MLLTCNNLFQNNRTRSVIICSSKYKYYWQHLWQWFCNIWFIL